jgi:hypothetical protein
MKSSALACVASGIAMLCPSFARAQNIVPNGQFDSLEGWTKLGNGGEFTLDAGDGSPDAPSASLTAGGSFATLIVSSCIPLSGPMTVDLQGDVKSNPTAPDFPAHVGVAFYSNDTCGTEAGFATAESCFALSNGWQRCASLNLAVPDNVRSASVQASVLNFGISAKFDNIRLGPTGTVPVTLQSFDVD